MTNLQGRDREPTGFAAIAGDDAPPQPEYWDVKQWCIDVGFGVGAIAVGVAGLVLPVLPGWLAIIAGVFALSGRIPPLRRFMSRLMMTKPVQATIDRIARNEQARRLMTRALLRTTVREGVDSPARQRIVNTLAQRNAEAYLDSDQIEE